MRFRPSGFPAVTFAGPLAAAGALLSVTTPGSARAAMPPSEAAAPVGALLADPARLVAWLRARNADVGAAAARVREAQGDLGQSRLRPNPALAFSLSDVPVGATNPRGLRFADTSIYGVTLSQTLEMGKRAPRIESARLRLESDRQSYLDAVVQKAAEAREALGRVAYLKSRQAVLEESQAAARQVLDLQRARLEAGDLSGNDYDRLRLDTLLLESDLARNQSEVRAALAACRALLFASCAADDAGPAALETAPLLPPLGPAAETAETAAAGRPDVQALELSARSARQDALLARRRALPDFGLSLGYTRDYLTISGDQPRSLVFNVSLPIPAFDRGQHDAARAEARASEMELSAQALGTRVRAQVASLMEERASLEAALHRLREDAVPRSASILDATVGAVIHGELSMTDLLLARRTHTELRLKALELQWSVFGVGNGLRTALGLDAALVGEAATASGP